MPGSDAASMTALGIKLSGLGAGSEVNLWRLEVRDELPESLPEGKGFSGLVGGRTQDIRPAGG